MRTKYIIGRIGTKQVVYDLRVESS